MTQLRFGVFVPPYHNMEHNISLAIERDLELAEGLDRFGFDSRLFAHLPLRGLCGGLARFDVSLRQHPFMRLSTSPNQQDLRGSTVVSMHHAAGVTQRYAVR